MLKRGHERVHFREILLNLFHQRRLLLILFGIIFLLLIALIIYFSLPQKNICGDGTLYRECSERQPYFCENGVLIEKASVCGCFENLTISGDSCFSDYQTNPKEISLKYILRGEEKTMNFIVYDGITEYFSKLSRKIDYDGKNPSRADFKLLKLDEEEQRYLLLPLITEIQNSADNEKDRIRIAVSLVQNIPFGSSDKSVWIAGNKMIYSRYPYEVLYEREGICGEKSELLAFILREMGYDVGFFYYVQENHEAVALKCPIWWGVKKGYCLIETTGPSIISDKGIEYVGVGKLSSTPELLVVSEGKSIGNFWYEYWDANKLDRIRKGVALFWERRLEKLKEKYGLVDMYNV